jgi:hypothetical protein
VEHGIIEVELTFLPAKDGGRSAPVRSGIARSFTSRMVIGERSMITSAWRRFSPGKLPARNCDLGRNAAGSQARFGRSSFAREIASSVMAR